MAAMAEALGRPLLPWQRQVADVMGETLPDGRFRYPVAILLVPRRAGKTVLTLAQSLQRCTIRPDARAWYTAQTGGDAADTFREEWVPLVERSPLAPWLRVRLSNGSQRFTLPDALGGRFGIFAPTEKALHGKDGDYVTLDEYWAHDEAKGEQLDAAIRPTMATRPHRQVVKVSAGGTEESTALLGARKMGRGLVEAGRCQEAGVAYFEWYPHEGADLEDPATWAATHPAVGHTIDLDTLKQDRQTMSRDLFMRSYLNVFTSSQGERLIPADAWDACRVPLEVAGGLEVPRAGVWTGYDVSADREHGAVVACWRLPDGRLYVEVVDYRPRPSEWMTDTLVRLRGKGHRLIADGRGPVSTVTADLARRGVQVQELSTGAYVTACAQLLDDVLSARLVHSGQAQLDSAAAQVARREVGDAWAWTRKRSGADVSPLVAATAATEGGRRPVAAAPRIAS